MGEERAVRKLSAGVGWKRLYAGKEASLEAVAAVLSEGQGPD